MDWMTTPKPSQLLYAYAVNPWDEIVPGLWMGGHVYAAPANKKNPLGRAHAEPGDQFDTVVSLHTRRTGWPGPATRHVIHHISDDALPLSTVEAMKRLGADVAREVEQGRKVLVRCRAGYNRSGLVTGFALMEMGHTADDAVRLIREKRGRFALANPYFVDYLLANN